jgi:photosystem II stability/assembly factor-like uncharacterized protein
MDLQLVVATGQGIVILERDEEGAWRQSSGAHDHDAFTAVATGDTITLAGTREGIFRSTDRGQTWWESDEGLAVPHVRWLALHPQDEERAFAGTEPAHIFVSRDGGRSWRGCPEVVNLREAHAWNLPYSPNAGCVRGFAFQGARGYAAVEQGGLLRSDDRGETWALVEGTTGEPSRAVPTSYIHSDVHSVVIHPDGPDHVLAPTAGGLFYSIDGGAHWRLLYECYARAVWVDPGRPGHMVLGPARSVDEDGRIEVSLNGGDSWERVMDGLEPFWPHHMVERFTQVEDELLAVLSNGRLIGATIDTWEWRDILPALDDVAAVAVLPAA